MIEYPGDTGPDSAAAAVRLAADLARIVAGRAPTAAELEIAPLLDGWTAALIPLTALAGDVSVTPYSAPGRSGPRRSTPSTRSAAGRGPGPDSTRLGSTAAERAAGDRG